MKAKKTSQVSAFFNDQSYDDKNMESSTEPYSSTSTKSQGLDKREPDDLRMINQHPEFEVRIASNPTVIR